MNSKIKGFDVVKTIKERLIEESRDIFDLQQNEQLEFYSKPENLIKLKSPQKLIIKKVFIDELGIQNMKSNGFEPHYSYYMTENAIVINVEIPGIFTLQSSTQTAGEYNTIRIFGTKINDLNKVVGNILINNGREFGDFSLEIPVRLEGYVIRNENPSFVRNDGVISIIYKKEKLLQPAPFVHEKIILQKN